MSSLLRSTKFVRYFAGAARTLILNSAKTAEANLLLNPKTLCVANKNLLRDYATTKKSDHLEPLLQKLDLEVRKYGRISKRDIDELFEEISGKNDITSSQSLLIIRCCGELVPEELPEQRTLLVQKIWSVLNEQGVPMDISHYNALIRVYIENEHPFSPAEFLEELEKKGLQPNRVTYQRLMWRYCQDGDVEGATKVLEKMRELNLPVSEPVLNALIMGHAYNGDTDGAKSVLETMAGAGLQPSNKTYTLLACGFAHKGDVAEIENILKIAQEQDIPLTDKDILDVIEALATRGHGSKVSSLLGHLHKGPGYNQDACNVILKLINKNQIDTAKEMLKTLRVADSFDQTMYKGAFFVKQLLRVQKPAEDVANICKELQEENLVPNAVYIATEAALQQGRSDIALMLFKELKKSGLEIRQHYYWPLLAMKAKENDEEGLMHILKDMSNEGLNVSGETLRDYVFPYLQNKDSTRDILLKLQIANVSKVHGARHLMVSLLDAGKIKEAANVAVQYSPFGQYGLVSRPLVNAVGKTKDVESFVTILHTISYKPNFIEETSEDAPSNDKDRINEVGKIVFSAFCNLHPPQYEALLNELLAKGLQIDTESAKKIENKLADQLTTSISEKLAKLTSNDLELAPLETPRQEKLPSSPTQLEKLIAQAKAKGAPTARLQKQLLYAYISQNQVDKVDSLLKELETDNFELTNSTLAYLFEYYCENNLIDKAFECKKMIEAKNDSTFNLSKIKIVAMAYALVRANRYDEAINFLKENKPNILENETFVLNTKCWQLLNDLAEKKEVEKVKEFSKLLIENNFIEPSNVIFGPSIKVHLLANDMEGALKEFENICKQYRCTPWKGELMKALIMKEDPNKLQWLADISTQIHGEVNILHDLVLAFVECGKLKQARRILETPGLLPRPKRLYTACERYVQDGKPEHLEGLLEATKELSHIDRSNIFYHLLVSYCNSNQTDKALGLWTLLQEEGEVPSEQFLNYLGTHLKSNNREVPFIIPGEALPKKPETKKTPKAQKPKQKPVKAVSSLIESLIKEGNLDKAAQLAKESIEEGATPKHSLLKFLLKSLAQNGQVETIESLGKFFDSTMKRNVTYDDKHTLAIFTKGDGQKHIEELHQSLLSAKTNEDLENVVIKFPRSNALAFVIDNEDLVKKCHEVAEKTAEKGFTMPCNLLWMEYLLAGKVKEADYLWNKYLRKSESIAFRRLLQESHLKNNPQLLENLIGCLKTNSHVTESVLGNVYSRLINLHVIYGNIEDAKLTLDKALTSGIKIEDINTTTLKRLKTAMETVGQEFKYTIPTKTNTQS